jgi:nitrate/TMAO reductase-like tetraheme cytochrome c subunit
MKYRDNILSFLIAFGLAAAAAYYAVMNPAVSELRYAGSKECSRCHESVYKSWKNTLHAKALIDKSGLALLSEFPAVTAKHAAIGETAEIVSAIGSHWTRRYLLSNNRVSPFLYSLLSNDFSDYYDINYRRSDYQSECIGCHTTGAHEIKEQAGGGARIAYAEAGVACEACHGPGSAHIQLSDIRHIVNPKKIDGARRDMICMSCHTNGYDKSGRYKFPLGYKPGKNLDDYFFNMSPKPGQIKYNHENRFDYKADGSIADRQRQYAYWRYMFMAAEGFSCEDCLDFRSASGKKGQAPQRFAADKKTGAVKTAPDFFTVNQYCMSCHSTLAPFRDYVGGAPASVGIDSKCDFIKYKMPLESAAREESCIECHKSESVHQHYYIIENAAGAR